MKWNIDDNTFVKLLDPETGDATRLVRMLTHQTEACQTHAIGTMTSTMRCCRCPAGRFFAAASLHRVATVSGCKLDCLAWAHVQLSTATGSREGVTSMS